MMLMIQVRETLHGIGRYRREHIRVTGGDRKIVRFVLRWPDMGAEGCHGNASAIGPDLPACRQSQAPQLSIVNLFENTASW
jgi:hypothetical protein